MPFVKGTYEAISHPTAKAPETAKTTTYIPKSSSAKTVSQDTVLTQKDFGEYNDLIQQIKDISEANTAKSASLASGQNEWQRETNKIAMDFNAAEAAKNRDWQEYMSNTAHQREVKDLQAAGLNPVLSATGGQGAYVGSGATASGVTSGGSRGDVDTGFEVALLNFLSNVMGYATSTASAGISAGGVIGAANINAAASLANNQLSNATNIRTTQMNNATSLQNTKLSTNSSQAIAQLQADNSYMIAAVNNRASMNRQQFEAWTESYIKSMYPQTSWQAIGAVVTKAIDLFYGPGETSKGVLTGSRGFSGSR